MITGIIAGLLTLVANAQSIVCPARPQPEFESPSFCPPEGDQSKGADPVLNKKKNRIDHARPDCPYHPVALPDMQNFDWPQGIEKRKRDEWTPQQRIDVGRWEGIPVWVEGYLALTSVKKNEPVGAKLSAGGSWNCGDEAHVDYILWLKSTPDESKAKAIVAVMTPRIRAHQRYWTIENLTRIAKGRYKVRIYGWLMLDQEHPEQVRKSRATLWEIHPITQIDYWEHGELQRLEFREPSLAEYVPKRLTRHSNQAASR